MYLNLLAETGVVGTFAFLLLVIAAVSAAYRGSRVRDPANRAICMAVGIGLVMLLIDGIVHVPIYNPESTMVLFALLGVSTVFVQIDRREHEEAEEAGL
jgi:O-antigen ligase